MVGINKSLRHIYCIREISVRAIKDQMKYCDRSFLIKQAFTELSSQCDTKTKYYMTTMN